MNSTFQLINRSHLNRTSFVHYIIHFFLKKIVQCETTIDILEGKKMAFPHTYQFFGLCLYIFIFMYFIACNFTHIEFDCLHELFQHDAVLSVIENAK